MVYNGRKCWIHPRSSAAVGLCLSIRCSNSEISGAREGTSSLPPSFLVLMHRKHISRVPPKRMPSQVAKVFLRGADEQSVQGKKQSRSLDSSSLPNRTKLVGVAFSLNGPLPLGSARQSETVRFDWCGGGGPLRGRKKGSSLS
jgi:hypothetical protein